jgi:hypothetical protein
MPITKRSDDGSIEVSVSKKANGKFTVSARQLVEGNIWALIGVIFGPDNSTVLDYKTQDVSHCWEDIAGSHLEDVQEVRISTMRVP